MVNDENRGFFCMDFNDDFKIYGRESASDYQRIDLGFVPCNSMATEAGVTGPPMTPECIEDLEQKKAYLGPIDIVLFFNDESFN